MAQKRKTIGACVDECVSRETEAWFSEHAGMRTRELAATESIVQVLVTVQRLSLGRLKVCVGITAKVREECTQNIWEYQLDGKRGYVETTKSKPKH